MMDQQHIFSFPQKISCKALKIKVLLKADSSGNMPPDSSSIFRGMIGKVFRDQACINKGQECEACPFISACPYGSIFEPTSEVFAPEFSEKTKFLTPPLIVCGPYFRENNWNKNEEVELTITIFGDYGEYMPDFHEALKMVGRLGVGKDRIRFSVIQNRQQFFDGKEEVLAKEGVLLKEPAIYEYSWTSSADNIGKVLIKLETPLRYKAKGKIVTDISVSSFIHTVFRRVEFLTSLYSTNPITFDGRKMEVVINSLQITDKQISTTDFERYSGRQKNVMNWKGVIGSFVLTGNLSPLIHLLKFAGEFHIGKQTVFGLGKFSVWRKI
jgi:hypothetical protein